MRVLAVGRERGRGLPRAAGRDRHRARAAPARCGCPATTASCAARRRGRRTPRRPRDLAAGVWERGRPDAHPGPPAAFAFPLPGVGVMGFSTAAPLEPDASLLATMDSLGSQISQFVERCRAQAAVRASDARKSAILNAAFDCIITMDHHGNVVEVNRAAERTFGYRAERDDRARTGRADRAAVLARRAPRGGRALRAHGPRGASAGTRSRRQGMRSDGSEFPVELIVTRPDAPRPAAVLRLPARRDRDARARARPAPARRPSRRRCGASRRAVARRARPAARVRRRHRGGRAPARRAELEHGPLRRRPARDRRRRWNEGGVRNVPVGDTVRMDGDTASTRVFRTGAPARVDSYAEHPGRARRRAAQRSGSVAPSRRRSSSAAGCGAR